MSSDEGETWCVEYEFIQKHSELQWKSYQQLLSEKKITLPHAPGMEINWDERIQRTKYRYL